MTLRSQTSCFILLSALCIQHCAETVAPFSRNVLRTCPILWTQPQLWAQLRGKLLRIFCFFGSLIGIKDLKHVPWITSPNYFHLLTLMLFIAVQLFSGFLPGLSPPQAWGWANSSANQRQESRDLQELFDGRHHTELEKEVWLERMVDCSSMWSRLKY